MLDIHFIQEHPDILKAACKNKKVDVDVDVLLKLDAERREAQGKLDEVSRKRNEAAKAKDIETGKALKQEAVALEAKTKEIEAALTPMLLKLPNIPSDDTPIGPDESGNVVIRKVGEPTKFSFKHKDHIALGEALGIIDSEKASEVTGTRFTYLKGDLVMVQYALITYAFSVLTSPGLLHEIIAERGLDLPEKPFMPVVPPLMINPTVFQRMGRLEPREERYHIPSDDLYLIGSAEHTLGPLHMDETLRENELPLRYVACTPAFRREAGSYGKDVKGILRLHQFDKIEMESFSLPEHSRDEQELFIGIQEHLLKGLGVPYQVVQICTGDMGGPDSRQVDVECWMPGQNRYRETHTSDLMTDFQARRLGTRVKRNTGKSEFVHMNDATCIAIGRVLIAIMENFQEEDGRIRIPTVLLPYMNGKTHIG